VAVCGAIHRAAAHPSAYRPHTHASNARCPSPHPADTCACRLAPISLKPKPNTLSSALSRVQPCRVALCEVPGALEGLGEEHGVDPASRRPACPPREVCAAAGRSTPCAEEDQPLLDPWSGCAAVACLAVAPAVAGLASRPSAAADRAVWGRCLGSHMTISNLRVPLSPAPSNTPTPHKHTLPPPPHSPTPTPPCPQPCKEELESLKLLVQLPGQQPRALTLGCAAPRRAALRWGPSHSDACLGSERAHGCHRWAGPDIALVAPPCRRLLRQAGLLRGGSALTDPLKRWWRLAGPAAASMCAFAV
jgi:hypothetical protein